MGYLARYYEPVAPPVTLHIPGTKSNTLPVGAGLLPRLPFVLSRDGGIHGHNLKAQMG